MIQKLGQGGPVFRHSFNGFLRNLVSRISKYKEKGHRERSRLCAENEGSVPKGYASWRKPTDFVRHDLSRLDPRSCGYESLLEGQVYYGQAILGVIKKSNEKLILLKKDESFSVGFDVS